MMFILFSCFNHIKGILHTCSHISFQEKVYFYFISFCIIAECFNQLIHNLVNVQYRKLAHIGTNAYFLGKPFSFRIGTQRIHSDILSSFFHCFSEGTLHSCLFENDCAFMSNKCCTPLCKGAAHNDFTSWKDLVLC